MSDSNHIADEVVDERRLHELVHAIRRRAPLDAVVLLERENNPTVAAVLQKLDYELAVRLLSHLPGDRAEELLTCPRQRHQYLS